MVGLARRCHDAVLIVPRASLAGTGEQDGRIWCPELYEGAGLTERDAGRADPVPLACPVLGTGYSSGRQVWDETSRRRDWTGRSWERVAPQLGSAIAVDHIECASPKLR